VIEGKVTDEDMVAVLGSALTDGVDLSGDIPEKYIIPWKEAAVGDYVRTCDQWCKVTANDGDNLKLAVLERHPPGPIRWQIGRDDE